MFGNWSCIAIDIGEESSFFVVWCGIEEIDSWRPVRIVWARLSFFCLDEREAFVETLRDLIYTLLLTWRCPCQGISGSIVVIMSPFQTLRLCYLFILPSDRNYLV